MSLTDTFRKRNTRPAEGADPAQAFGAEELTMEEFRRQNFIPPEKKGPGLAARAGAALSGLRSRIVGEEGSDDADFAASYAPETPQEPAPVYSAQNYQSESAPDLGWENPFTDPAPAQKKAEPRRSPAPEPPVYQYQPAPDYGYYPQEYAPEPDYYGAQAQYAPPEAWESASYAQPSYDPYQDQPPYDPYQEAWQEPTPEYPGESMDGGSWYGTDNMPPARAIARPKTEPGDFKYMFWAGGIVLSMFLTIVSFIYGCAV